MGRRLRASDQSKATRPKPSPVEVRNIAHPKVWKTAMMVARTDRARITVETFTRLSVQVD
jgi:hypothetical protein